MSFLPKDYVGVHTRVQQFHEKYKEWSISTDSEMIWEDTVKFKARVYLYKDKIQSFDWQSFINVKKDKAFEKWETVAVWRALAFAGFEIKSWIASEDEMQKFNSSKDEPATKPSSNDDLPWMDVTAFNKMKENIDELKKGKNNWYDLVKLARQKYKVNKNFAQQIELLYK